MVSTFRFAGVGVFLLALLGVAGWEPFGTGLNPSLAQIAAQESPEQDDEGKKGDPKKGSETDPKKAGKDGKDKDSPTDGKSDPKKSGKDTKGKDGKDGEDTKSSGTANLLKKTTKKSTDKNEAAKSPYVKLQTIPAEITSYDETGRVLTLKVTQVAIVPRLEGKTVKGEVKTKDHQVKAILTDDAKIRILNPPPLFDDKGRPKRYTAKELKELRGEDTKTPGYPADTSELVPRARVQVDLVLKREDYQRMRSKKKSDDPLPEVPSTNLVIVIAPPPPTP